MTVSTDPTPKAERSRNPRGQGSRLRDEILDAAESLLADGEPVTLRSIARRAGIAAPSIYRHYPDVDSIMATVAERAFAQLAAHLSAGPVGVGPEDRVHAIAERYLSYAQDHPEHYRLMFGGVWNAAAALAQHPEQAERLNALGSDTMAVLVDAIETCVTAGVSLSNDPYRDAVALWVALDGLAHQRRVAPLFAWPPALPRTIVTALARLRADPA